MPRVPIVNPLLDTVLHLRRPDRAALVAATRAALEHFPALAACDRERLLRSIVVRDARNRLVFRAMAALPAAAAFVARLLPITGDAAAIAAAPAGRPLLLAFMHLGPAHFTVAMAMRLLAGRTVYVLHAGGLTGRASARILRGIGTLPVLTDRDALRTVGDAMRHDPHCAVFVFFDHLSGRGRQSVSFLGAGIRVPTGIAHLACEHDALVVTGNWESALVPRVRIGRSFEIDRSSDLESAQARLVEQLFAELEGRVRVAPQEWTEWWNCFA